MGPSSEFLDKLGGRKMALTLLVIVVGALVDVFGKNGLSANLAGLLVGATAVFGAANAAVTMQVSKASKQDQPTSSVSDLDELRTAVYNNVEYATQERAIQTDAIKDLQGRMSASEDALNSATQLIKALMKIKSDN